MSKENHNIIPAFRFPEFEKSGTWEFEKLGTPEISSFVKDKMPLDKLDLETYVSTENMLQDFGGVKRSNKLPNSGSFTHFKKDDILMANIRPYLKKVWFAESEGNASNDVLVFRSGSRVISSYLQYLLKNDSFINFVMKGAKGVKMPRGDKSLMQNYPVPIPPNKKEQQKIADCLSSLDDLIGAESDKLDQLKDHKKGLLQQLFPAEGETVPKLRFPEFENDGNWILEPLSKVYSFKITNSFSRDKLNYENGSVKNIHYGDIHTKFSTLFDITKETVPFINMNVSISKISHENYCLEGDIVFADASEDIDDVGKSIEIVNINGEKLLSGLHTFLARQIIPKLIIGFGGYLFKSNSIREQIKKESQGAKVLGISKGRISDIKIYYPKNKKEQQKIVDCFSSIDDSITAQAEKVDALKDHKKGLMQQLFPNLNEIAVA